MLESSLTRGPFVAIEPANGRAKIMRSVLAAAALNPAEWRFGLGWGVAAPRRAADPSSWLLRVKRLEPRYDQC